MWQWMPHTLEVSDESDECNYRHKSLINMKIIKSMRKRREIPVIRAAEKVQNVERMRKGRQNTKAQ